MSHSIRLKDTSLNAVLFNWPRRDDYLAFCGGLIPGAVCFESGRFAEAALPPLALLLVVVLVPCVVVSGEVAAFGLAEVAGLSDEAQPDQQTATPSRTNNIKLFRIKRLLLLGCYLFITGVEDAALAQDYRNYS